MTKTSIKQKKFDRTQKANMKHILSGALFTIILHYSLTYIALSLGEGSKSAIIKQIGFLFLSCFAYICFASVSAYLTWNILLKYNSLSKLAVIKFAEPLFAVILSGLILNENIFKITYLLALLLILTAILIENLKQKNKFYKKVCFYTKFQVKYF